MPAPDVSLDGEEHILVLAPTGQDAFLIVSNIAETSAKIVPHIESLCEYVRRGAAAVIIVAEEALTVPGIVLLNNALGEQDAWSDIPIILMTSGGEPTVAVLRIKNAFSPSGNVTLLERPFRRITLQSIIQVALRARKKQHEVKNLLEKQRTATELRDEFISVAGHELRTPLTSLKLQTQLHQRLIAQGDVAVYAPERMRRLVELTGRQVERLTRLVDDMLDISRINTGKLTLQWETFDLGELVRETAERLRPQLESAGCLVTLHGCESIVGSWDYDRIEQVLSNLLTNVLRHCPGTPATVHLSRCDQRATLTVRDQGRGIAPENRERIFKRFERGTTKGATGLGLGLYICREIVEAHRGTIHVESAPAGGSSFIVTLPIADPRTVHAIPETAGLRSASR